MRGAYGNTPEGDWACSLRRVSSYRVGDQHAVCCAIPHASYFEEVDLYMYSHSISFPTLWMRVKGEIVICFC